MKVSTQTHSYIPSSFNSHHTAVCIPVKNEKLPPTRKIKLYAQYRNHSNKVSVLSYRGKEYLSKTFNQTVIDAVVEDGCLIVTTADNCVRHFDVMTGKLLAEIWPTPPQDGSGDTIFTLAA